jgi:NADH-quinone oxidoreductase subunit A
MDESHLNAYAPLLLHLLAAMGLSAVILLVSTFVGRRRPGRAKLTAYECGVQPTGDAREPFSVKFYLVAIAFILFDAETMFFFPWAYVYSELRLFGFFAMLVYIIVLAVGDIYLWKKGVFDWSR